MAKQRILVVDDEEDILELLKYNLSREGYATDCVTSGEEGLRVAERAPPDLMILDLMLPGMDGLEVCRKLKGGDRTRQVPIVMLTAKGEEADIVAGLELGADDYITKPFSPRVLAARIKAVLRRRDESAPDAEAAVHVGDLSVDPVRHEVLVKGKPVELTYTEFQILHFLARGPGRVFTRYQIVDGAQGGDVVVTDRSVDVHMVSLRRKLSSCGQYIQTVRGVGYRFKDA